MKGGLKRLAQAGAVALTLGGAAEAQEAQQVSFELEPTVVEQITANYQECIDIVVEDLDENGNGRVDGNEDAEFYNELAGYCEEDLQREVAHAEKMAAGEVRIAALQADTAKQNELQTVAEAGTAAAEARSTVAKDRSAAAIESSRKLTEEIMAGARKEAGL